MSAVAEFTIPAAALPFGDALAEASEVRIELERIVPTRESALPFFWVWGPNPEAFLERARGEPNLADAAMLERVDDGALFRAEWSPNAEIIQGIERLDATIIDATGTADCWRFEIRTEESEAFREFQRIFDRQGIPVHLQRIYSLADLVEDDNRQLTPVQRETLLAAYREGYFDQPRKTTQAELGEQFGVSRRAVSDRLRRGTRRLVATTLLPSGEQT